MNKLLMILAVVSVGFLSSCNKCKDKTCANGAECDKKSGDCSDVCQNGGTSSTADGSCSCTAFYEGATCGDEVRAKYKGTYNATTKITQLPNNPPMPTSIQVTNTGTDATELTFNLTITTGPNDNTSIEVKANLTSATEFTIVETNIPFTLIPTSTMAKATGSGSFDGDDVSAVITLEALDGQAQGSKFEATVTGNK